MSHVPVPGYTGEYPFEVYRYSSGNSALVQRMTRMPDGLWFPDDAPDVPEIRYDLEAASAHALMWQRRVALDTVMDVIGRNYTGLSRDERDALEAARLELCEWAPRLGYRG